MDPKMIVETFERIERDHGGLAKIDASLTLEKTAIELGIPMSDVRSVMLDHWTMRGAG